MRTILLTVLALLFVGDAHAQSTVVTGRLLTADGAPATQGHVMLVRNASAFPRGILHTVEPDEFGRFEITLDAPKMHTLRFTAPVHRGPERAFYAEPGDTIEVEVRLGSLVFDPDRFMISYGRPSAPSVRLRDGYYGALDTNTVAPRWTRVTVPVPPDDTPFSIALPSPDDSLAYVIRATGWLFANDQLTWTSNPGGGAVAVDRGGGYSTVLATPRDSVSIAFDPADWPREATAHDVRWIRGSQRAKQFYDIDADVQRRREAHRRQTRDQRNSGVIGALTETDWTSDVADLKRAVEQADDPFERGVRTMAYLRVVGTATYGKREGIALFVSRDEAEQMLQTLAPDSPLWSYRPSIALAVIRIASGPPRSRSAEGTTLLPMPDPLRSDRRMSARYRDYALALANHPDTTAAHHWLQSGMRYGADTDDYVTYSRFAARFFERFGGTASGEIELRRLKYDDATPPGTVLPSFTVPSLDNPDRMIQSDDFRGDPVYVSFWATWCRPCLPKLERLAELHERFGADGLQILTISTDFDSKYAIAYRDDHQPMPWSNAFVGAGEEAQDGLLTQLGVLGIPYGILVDAEGYVVAVDKGGGDLEAVVAALMRRE